MNTTMSVRVQGKTYEVEEEEGGNYLNLQELDLTSILEVEGLDELPCVDILNLEGNKLTTIEGLEKVSRLRNVDLSDNEFTKISGLETIPRLESIDLSSNRITRIEGFEYSPSLDSITLTQNQISQIEGLDKLPHLGVLDLRFNQIAKIEGLNNLPKLGWLMLDHNKITRLEGLGTVTKLRELSLYENQIQKIEGLGQLTALRSLDLRKNPITWPTGLSEVSPPAEIVAYCLAEERHIPFTDLKAYNSLLAKLFTNTRIYNENTIPYFIALDANVEHLEFQRLETLGKVTLPAIVTELVLNHNKSLNNSDIEAIKSSLTNNQMRTEYCKTLQITSVSLKGHYERVFLAFLGAIQMNNGYEETKAWFKSTFFTQRIAPAIQDAILRKDATS